MAVGAAAGLVPFEAGVAFASGLGFSRDIRLLADLVNVVAVLRAAAAIWAARDEAGAVGALPAAVAVRDAIGAAPGALPLARAPGVCAALGGVTACPAARFGCAEAG